MYTSEHPAALCKTPATGFEAGLTRALNNSIVRWLRQHALALISVPLVTAVSFMALSQSTTPPSIPAIALSADPLYATATGDKPALALALSVEFPTVGAQYVDPDNNNSSTSDDVTYSPTIEYLGYYDAESCYTYDNAGTGAPSGQTSNYKRFVRRGPALPLTTANSANPTWTSRLCWNGTKSYSKDDGTSPAFSTSTNDAFSGNFLNWASSSAIDMLRLSLTGGDRVIDTPTLTVLQRAIIPDGDPISMGNSSNFPSKRLYKTGTSRAITSTNFASASYASGVPYFGAVPSTMAAAAAAATTTGDIFVANTLNRIYFGTSRTTGNNVSASGLTSYTLGIPTTTNWMGTISNSPQLSGWGSSVATRGQTITLTGVQEVLYGRNTTWRSAPASGVITCSDTTFGGSTSSSAVCYVRPNTTSENPPASTALTTDPYFFARVQVCDRDASTYALKDNRYWSLCTKYSDGATTPNPAYKPTGAIQKYSDQLRLAAFGYLMDQNTSRYGGVLRAPIKYVGARTFDTNGTENTPSGGNTKQEWNPVTGVFYANPDANSTVQTTDGRAVYLSGVISYVNQFGRTGSVLGRYKKYDPVGELHYQAVRYLQGLPPSSAAISSITTDIDMYDGFPVTTTWTDPYGDGRSNTADYSCMKSNIVVIGDINTWDYNNRLPSASAANNIPDIAYWQGIAANFESNTSGTYLDGAGVSRTIANPNTANSAGLTSASGNVSLVGSAYWAHTHDIRGTGWTNATTAGTSGTTLQRPGLRVKTFTFDVNEYGGSSSATTRRSSNQLFRAAKYGGFETDPSNTAKNPYNTRGNPFVNEADGTNNNYVWQDTDTRASRVGEANTYFLQSDARGVLSAFDDIFSRASTAARSIAGGAIQSKNLTQAGNTIYQGTFDTSDWSGDLLAIPVTVSTSNVVAIPTSTTWTAATQLATLTAPATSRNIVVGKISATANPVATAFTWAAIEGGLQTALDKATPTSSADGLAQDRLNYLRGDSSKEGSPFRKRNKLLGDIINSGVAYSGVPSTSISSGTYASFASTNAARTPAVFVGANDGMLHAFNATNGNEMFAYIPSWLGPKLSALTSTSYVNAHQSYVDGTPVVAEAQVGSAGTAADWKTVLVSGTGGGGQGVFALDVTNPSTFSAANVMWEFTHADDQDMGNVTGRPQILKLRTSAYNATTATYKWFAVVGSGVNNYVTDSAGLFSSTGNPALFLLDLSKAAGTAWTLGSNYYKISIPVNSTLSASNATGLINFRAALGAAREVTQIYMGDLHGNLWKLDFSLSLGSTEWNINKLSAFNKGTVGSPDPYPLFIAKDSSGNVQPITMAPSIAFGPERDTSYVFFGTGKYYETSDKGTTTTQSEYMVFDNGTGSGDTLVSPAVRASAISGRLRLKQGTANATTGVISTPAFTPGRASTDVNTEVIRSGWYADLPTSGERQTSNATVFGTNVVFGSLIPGATGSSSCSAAAGGGNQYTVDIATGNGNSVGSSVGVLGEPLVSEISGATTYTATDSTGRRTKTITSQLFQQGSSGVSVGRTSTITLAAGRLSWRKIHNYQDLKNAP